MILFSLIYNSSQEKYGCNDLTYKGGYYFEVESGKLANGKLKCIEDLNNDGYIYEEYSNYKDGIKVGKWGYIEANDTIYQAETTIDSKLSEDLCLKFNAKFIGLEIFKERDIKGFNLTIYNPEKILDSIEIQNILDSDLKEFMIKDQINKARFYFLNKNGVWVDKDSFELTK